MTIQSPRKQARQKPLRTVLATSCLALLALGSTASSQVIVSPTVSSSGGIFTYSYSVTNNGLFDLAIVNVPVTTAGNLMSLIAPTGFGISFDPGVGIVSFFEDADPLTLQTFSPGSTRGLFMFTSTLRPGAATFDALDIGANTFTGATLAPGGVVTPPAPIIVARVTDVGAIFSTFLTGLPLALAQREVLLNVAHSTTRDVNNRLFRMRAGLYDDEAGAQGPKGGARVSDGKSMQSGKEYKTENVETYRQFELFGSGDFNAFDLEDRGGINGFNENVQAGAAGLEFHANRHLTLGLAVSYVNSDAELSRRAGGIDIEGGAVTAYISAVWQGFYADALYSYGQFSETTHRHTLVGRTARGDADSHNHSVEFNTGYTFNLGQVKTGPLVSVQYVNGDLDAFNERGGGSAALRFNAQAYDSLITRVGWQLSLPTQTRIGKITPQVRASWDRENLDDSESVGVALQNTPFRTITGFGTANPVVTKGGKFSTTAKTIAPGRDYLNVGAGLAVQLSDRASIILDYETHIFRQNETAHLGSVKVAWVF